MRAGLINKRGKLYIVITYDDELGKEKKKWFGTGLDDNRSNKKIANQLKEEKLEEFRKTYKFMERDGSEMLFADYLQQWLERSKSNLQVSTYSTYEMQVNKIADYFRAKGITLIDLQPLDISNFYVYLQKEGKSIQLCEHYHVNIRKALQTAVRANLIPYNPADRIDRPKSPKHIADYYNKDELTKLFNCMNGDSFAYIYKMTAYYGLRRSEVMGIKWDAIDFDKNTLTLKHTVIQTRLNGKSVIVAKDRMKNQSSFRTLPLLPEIKEILLDLKKSQDKNRELYGYQYCQKYNDYVCVNDLGFRLNPETVSSHFQLILRNNNLKRIKFHELRHSCASLLLDKGVSMKEIQEWLGHSSYNTTANIYSHLDYSSKQNIANVLNKTFDIDESEKVDNHGMFNRDEIIDKPKPQHINNEIKDSEKGFLIAYLDTDANTLSYAKSLKSITSNYKILSKIKYNEDISNLMIDLFGENEFEFEDITEYGMKLKKKLKALQEENEM